MSGNTIVGVDVGGTFTDLFYFDEADAPFPHRQGAVQPRRRGMSASSRACGPSGPVSALGSIVHGTTVGTNALLERKGARIGIITTRGFRDVLEMRRRDRPQHLGTVGRFRARSPTATCGSRSRNARWPTARSAMPWTPTRSAPRRAHARRARCRGARDRLHQRLRQPGQRARRLRGRARGLAKRRTSRLRREILPEIREFERASTTALNAYLQPVVGSYLGKLEAALRGDGFAGEFHIVQSNGGVMSTATARKLPVRTALSGPGRRRDRGRRHRARGRLSQCHHRRSRRHLVRCVADRRRRDRRSRRRPPSISAWSSARR